MGNQEGRKGVVNKVPITTSLHFSKICSFFSKNCISFISFFFEHRFQNFLIAMYNNCSESFIEKDPICFLIDQNLFDHLIGFQEQ